MTAQRIEFGLRDTTDAGCACCAPATGSAHTGSAHAGGGAHAHGAGHAGVEASVSAVSAEVLVTGMTCSHCVASVTEELTEIAGVDAVVVDLNAGGVSRVTISSDAPIDAEAIRAAVEEAGYALAGPAA